MFKHKHKLLKWLLSPETVYRGHVLSLYSRLLGEHYVIPLGTTSVEYRNQNGLMPGSLPTQWPDCSGS